MTTTPSQNLLTRPWYDRWWSMTLLFLLFTGLITILVHNVLNNNLIGADFYTIWMGGQAFLQHQDAYSQEVMQNTQMGIYGHLAQPGQDHLGYAYPAYNLVLLVPFLLMDFPWASAAWLSFNLVALLAALVFLSQNRAKFLIPMIPFIYPFAFCMLIGNFPVIFAVSIFLYIGLFVRDNTRTTAVQIIMGILLAWTTSKPQFMWLYLSFLLLHAYRSRLCPLLVSFASGLVGMLIITNIWVPGWPQMWISRVFEYASYHSYKTEMVIHSILRIAFPPSLVTPVTGILLTAFAVVTVWMLVTWWKDRLDIVAMIAWIGFVTYAVDVYALSNTQVLFWIPMILWAFQPKKITAGFVLFWVGNLILSWLLFAFGAVYHLNGPVREWPFLLYLPWMAWFLWQKIFRNDGPLQSWHIQVNRI